MIHVGRENVCTTKRWTLCFWWGNIKLAQVNAPTSKVQLSAHTERISQMCFPTTRRGQRQGAKTAWWEPRLLGAYWWEGRGWGRTARREYVFCSPACRINSWHEHNVSPLCFLTLCTKQWNSQGPATTPVKAALSLRLVTNTLWSDLTHLLKDSLCNLRNKTLYVESWWERERSALN